MKMAPSGSKRGSIVDTNETSTKRQRKPVDRLIDSVGIAESAKPHDSKSVSRVAVSITVEPTNQGIPKKNSNGEYCFPDFPEFRPNLSPKDVMQLGSFGGTYFRSIKSSVTGIHYGTDQWKEFPKDWFEGLNISRQVTSSTYRNNENRYNVHCGGDLEMWESSGWITSIDPYGWFQWYCRFFLGRRTSDDARQVSRGLGVIGPKGRWRNNLINKCLNSGLPLEKAVDDVSISPKVRQLLQHWGFQLSLDHLKAAAKKVRK